MTVYRSRLKTQSWAGETIGILVLDCFYPFIPGNVANATTYDFPVRFAVVEGATNDRLIYDQDPDLTDSFVAAAKKLESEGVKAITAACGFMALFQQEISTAVNVPVFASSLLQIPFIHQITNRPVGVISADQTKLLPLHFERCGISKDIPVVVAGMEAVPSFTQAVFQPDGTWDDIAIRQGVLDVTQTLIEKTPQIGAILLECSDLPPYAVDIQNRFGLPVFDFITMINYVHATLAHRPYTGLI